MQQEIKYYGMTKEDMIKREKLCLELMSEDLSIKEADLFISSLFEKGFANDDDNNKIRTYYKRFITWQPNNDFFDMAKQLERLFFDYYMFKAKYNKK